VTIIEPSVELIWITPNSIDVIEAGARNCYKSEGLRDPAKSEEFVSRVVRQYHHESVVEHASACFRIVCDRAIMAEITRHRLASYSVESTRYVNYCKEKHGGGDIQFLMPLGLTQGQEEKVRATYAMAEFAYNECISAGMTPQQARDLLPLGLKTEIIMTCNFREWAHFLKLRSASSAHPKIQVVARMVGAILALECPCIFGEYSEAT
jgi:thymidylate synthase (FAD)